MASHNSPFSKGLILGVLTDMVGCIKELLLDGKAVKIGDLAIFSLGIKSIGADTLEDAKTNLVTGYRFKARATGEMTVAELKSSIKLRELKHYMGADVNTEDDEHNPDDPEDNGVNGSNSNGNTPMPDATTYRVTYKFHDGTEEDQQYAVGATIAVPANTEGYHWDSLPEVMPANNLTVNEVANSNPGEGYVPPSNGGGFD